MSKATFSTNPNRPNPSNGQREATFTTPPELEAAPYPGSMRQSDRATIEALNDSPPSAFPGSGMPGEPWKRSSPPTTRGLAR